MNVLLIQLKRIGDLILTVPAIAAVRKDFPSARITLIVGHGSSELLPAIPGVDRTFVARGRVTDAGQWIALAASKFDYCLDFSRTDRSAMLSLLSGARKRITYDTIRREPMRQLCYNEFVPSQVRFAHTVDHHLALLAPLGSHDSSGEVRLVLPRAAEAEAASLIAEHKLDDNFVVIHPGSARAEKFWVARRWAEVADWISEHERTQVVLTGVNARMERDHIAEIEKHMHRPAINLAGQLDLLSLAALLRRARLLLTIDSAPMHLAGVFGTPQVALFGPTNPFHWRPRFAPAVILRAGAAGPLTEFVPLQPPAPMKEISTAAVIGAIGSLLSIPAAQAS